MKNAHPCSKCSGTEVVRVPGSSARDTMPNTVFMGQIKARLAITRFVCASCGYSEEWIESPEDLAKLKRQYGLE